LKYPISIILLLFVVAAFTLVYSLSDTAAAPYERIDPPDNNVQATPEPDDITGEPDDEPDEDPIDDPADDPEDDPEHVFVEEGFITIELEEREIRMGYLLLVNHDHEYSIPFDIDLVRIADYITTPFRVQANDPRLHRSIIDPLDEMMADFRTATGNRTVAIRSAFRTYPRQQEVLNNWIRQVGRREALRYAALPRHSEHHTGLAFDFGNLTGEAMTGFTGTGNSAWFRRNSYRYGFILRYQQSKTHITQTANEPWHYRFVGLPHSALIYEKNWCLEEFIENIREYTYEEPMEFEYDGVLYGIFFAEGTSVRIPINTEFDISGNNIDGFIITITWVNTDYDTSLEV